MPAWKIEVVDEDDEYDGAVGKNFDYSLIKTLFPKL